MSIETQIIEFLQTQDATTGVLAKKLNLKQKSIRKVLGKMLKEKRVTRTDAQPFVYELLKKAPNPTAKKAPNPAKEKPPVKSAPRRGVKLTFRKATCLQCRGVFQLNSRQEDREFCDASCEIKFKQKLRRRLDLERWEAARKAVPKTQSQAEPHFTCILCGLPFGGHTSEKLCNKCDNIRRGLL